MARRRRDEAELRRTILAATERLLARRSFAELQVNEILAEAGIARGSFYLYFENKHEVLLALAGDALERGQQEGRRWAEETGDAATPAARADVVRTSIDAGVALWRAEAPVLRAVVETWPTDPALAALWRDAMDRFAARTAERIDADRADSVDSVDSVDSLALAAALTWASERLYYLAACEVPPFDDPDRLRAALVHLWSRALEAPV